VPVRPALADVAKRRKAFAEDRDCAERQVLPEDRPDGIGLGRVHHERLIPGVVADGHRPAHPHPLPLRGGHLVPDPLCRDLPLELREGEQDVLVRRAGLGCLRRGRTENSLRLRQWLLNHEVVKLCPEALNYPKASSG